MLRALILLLLLSACQTTGPGAGQLPAGPGGIAVGAVGSGVPPRLPADFRTKAALQLASQFVKDSTGPAEIYPEPEATAGLLGGQSSVVIRYPVVNSSVLLGSRPAMRCITLRTMASVVTFGSNVTRFTSPRVDPAECLPGRPFEPYLELNEIGERIRACRARGEAKCRLPVGRIAALRSPDRR